jgi:two-component system KDP operon response regulator KdpE
MADPAISAGVRPTRALLVEDDVNIVDLIRSNLAVRGFDAVVCTDGSRALKLLETEQPDIVLLDLMLPGGIDGFELCRLMRERSSVGIIVVSGRGGERDKVTALNQGADDYLTKPFSIEELLARINATLRRTRPVPVGQPSSALITVRDLVIDLTNRQVTRAGEPVHLTPTEFALLRELAVERGKLLSHAHLLRRVWGAGYATETEYVRVYVRRLRAKLEGEEGPPLILTQPRFGYSLVAE